VTHIEKVSRRGFLGSAIGAGALVLGVGVESAEAAAAAWSPSVYLGLEPNGTAVIVAHRSEMGTGIRSVLPMVVADELEADWQKVRVQQFRRGSARVRTTSSSTPRAARRQPTESW